MKRAVIYARVSTERQADEGLSVESQIQACRRKADELGAAVVNVYRDDGISGRTDARPGFRAAIHHCTLVGADFMVCWSSSRFARDQLDALSYKRELSSAGVRLVYASSGVDLETTEGWLADSFNLLRAFQLLPLSSLAAALAFAAMRRSYLKDLAAVRNL